MLAGFVPYLGFRSLSYHLNCVMLAESLPIMGIWVINTGTPSLCTINSHFIRLTPLCDLLRGDCTHIEWCSSAHATSCRSTAMCPFFVVSVLGISVIL